LSLCPFILFILVPLSCLYRCFDPLEQHDLAEMPEHRDTLNLMREKLLTHLRSTQTTFRWLQTKGSAAA